MTPEKIRYELDKLGLKQIDIAKELGVSKSAVCRVINFELKSLRIMAKVAEKIGRFPSFVFPNFPSDR